MTYQNLKKEKGVVVAKHSRSASGRMNTKKISAMIFAGTVFTLPFVGLAQIGIPCDGPDCRFEHLIILANNIIKFLMFTVAVPLAALGFMMLGVQILLHPNEADVRSNSKEIAGNIATGFFIMLAAFLLIKMVLFAFLNTDAGFTTFLLQ